MNMRVYLDDCREMPNGFDCVVKTAQEAIDLLKTGEVTYISLDHDLDLNGTGYDVACYIEENAHNGSLKRLEWSIHSANPDGVKRIRMALESAERAWNNN